MTTLKFDKSVKFMGVRYAAHEAFKVSDEDAAELKKAGAIILSVDPAVDEEPEAPATLAAEDESQESEVEETADEEQEAGEDAAQLKEKLLEYTVPELVKFAEERGIDLQKKTKKAEIYNIIVATLE